MSKLSIKEEMRVIDQRDFDWYDSLTEEERKKLSLYVLMRYTSSTGSNVHEINEHYLTTVNDAVNVHFSQFAKHPKLQHRLLQLAGIGSNQFHPWIAPGKRKKSKQGNAKLQDFYTTLFPHLKDDEIVIALDAMSKDEIKDMLEEAGIPKERVKDYFK